MADGIFNQSIFNDDIFNTHAGAGMAQASGGSGGQSKAVGARSLAQQQIGERPKRKVPALIHIKLEITTRQYSKALIYQKSRPQAIGTLYHKPNPLHAEAISEYISVVGEQQKARKLDAEYNRLRSRFFLEALQELKNGNSSCGSATRF